MLTDIDWDHGNAALSALAAALSTRGLDYAHRLALAPNTGVPSGRDLDGDGRLGTPRDAQGWGRFRGQGGLAVLSRLPIRRAAVRDLGGLLWRDLPGSAMAEDDPGRDVQRLSTTGHWVVPVETPGGGRLDLMVFHATPPVFDGPEDRNGRRNADEIRAWQVLLDGGLGDPPPGAFVIAGNANLDPDRGAGRRAAIRALLADPRLRDPAPGVPTVDWSRLELGEMRVSYVLPSAGLALRGAGSRAVPGAGEHRLVWIDVMPP